MAIKVTKRKKNRATPHIKRGDKLQAPKWEGWQEWTGEEFHRHKDRSREFYYSNYKAADLYPHTYKWMADNGYTKDDITKIKAAPLHSLSITAAICAKQLLDGMPDFNQKEDDYWQTLAGTMGNTQPVSLFLKKRIKQAIEAGTLVLKDRKEIADKKAKTVPPLSLSLIHI